MAGRLRIATTGIQDQWLTGEPQFSYFVMNYKKHTRFATEAVEIPFGGEKKLGGYAEVRIPNNMGDLIRSMMLKMTLEPLPESSDPLISNLYNTSLTTSIIEYADLRIGGQTIERVTGDYIYMYNQLHNNTDDIEQTLYFLGGHNNHLNVSNSYNTFYLNLPFYFYRHSSLAIPMCAITKQLVEVYVKFKDPGDDISFTYTTAGDIVTRNVTTDAGIRDISLITDFFFISEDERNFLKTRPMEYGITQLQKSTIQFKQGELKKSALLKFTNPVKELLFLAKEETGNNYSEPTLTPASLDLLGNAIVPGSSWDGIFPSDQFGQSVSMSADGTRVAIGAPRASSGRVKVYELIGSSWTQVGNDIDGDGGNSGYSVSMSSDGSRVGWSPHAIPANAEFQRRGRSSIRIFSHQ